MLGTNSPVAGFLLHLQGRSEMLDDKAPKGPIPHTTTPHPAAPHTTTQRPPVPPGAAASHLSRDAVHVPARRGSTTWLAVAGAAVALVLLFMWLSGSPDPAGTAVDTAPATVESSSTAPAEAMPPETAPTAVDPSQTAPAGDDATQDAPPAADPSN
jgi:hypothetical protein